MRAVTAVLSAVAAFAESTGAQPDSCAVWVGGKNEIAAEIWQMAGALVADSRLSGLNGGMAVGGVKIVEDYALAEGSAAAFIQPPIFAGAITLPSA